MSQSNMKTVCVVSSTRADYGILRPLIRRLFEDQELDARIAVTGMHLCPEFGNTIKEIRDDGFFIHKIVENQLSGDSAATMSKSMGMALVGFADYFYECAPDLVIVLGDRYEILAVCCAAVNQRLPIAHLHGGELTLGAVDNSFRHAITKMSSLHFTAAEEYHRRVIQMGEAPETVFNVGAMGVENIKTRSTMPLDDLSKKLGFALKEKKYAVVTFHPVTLEDHTEEVQVEELMRALDHFKNLNFIVTKANSDAGGRKINDMWARYVEKRDNFLFVDSLGVDKYLPALEYSAAMIGNSSSGMLEGPSLGIPTVNVGERQRGRLHCDSIINCLPTERSIKEAIEKALTPSFQISARNVDNPYGDGRASERIVEIIKDFLVNDRLAIKKSFFDLTGK